VKTIRDWNDFSLNFQKYKEELNQNELEAKRFEKIAEYKNDLVFTSLPYEIELMSKDSVLKEKRERWHQSLSKDVYVEEAINVLFDLKLANPIKTKLASAIKE
jgi:carboxyl-terminal processing protease